MVKVAVLFSVILRPIVAVMGGGWARDLSGMSMLRNLYKVVTCINAIISPIWIEERNTRVCIKSIIGFEID